MEQDHWVWVPEQVEDVVFANQEKVLILSVVISTETILIEIISADVIQMITVLALGWVVEGCLEVVEEAVLLVEVEDDAVAKTLKNVFAG